MTFKSPYVFLLLKTLIQIFLSVIFYNFYFTDVVSKFADKDTTLVLSQENIEDNVVEPPFFAFCMQPGAKKSILDGYKSVLV